MNLLLQDLDRLRADLIKLDPKHESRSESKRPRSPSSNEVFSFWQNL